MYALSLKTTQIILHRCDGTHNYLPFLKVPSQKFPRNSSGFNHKGWVEDSMGRSDSVYPFQVRFSQVMLLSWTQEGMTCKRLLSGDVLKRVSRLVVI